MSIMFYVISCSVRWRKRARSYWKLSKNCQKIGKYLKIKVFETLIKIDSLVWVGNDFTWLLLCFSSSALVLNGWKWSGFPGISPKIAEKINENTGFWHFD